MSSGASAVPALTTRRPRWVRWVGLALVLALAAAGYVTLRVYQRVQGYKELARISVDRFHRQLNAGEVTAIIAESAPGFRHASSPDDLRTRLEAVRAKLGPLRSTQQKALSWSVRSGVGELLTAEFESQYREGTARERFTLLLTGDAAKLYGYNISSSVLLKD